jgi:hypothetical protein
MSHSPDPAWEYALVEGLYGTGADRVAVCVPHMRFAPCRSCTKDEKNHWSSAAADVQLVREHHRKA